MRTFLNLRLSARLGAAFGFLIVALLVIALVGLDSVGKVNGTAESLSGRDLAALEELVTVSEDFNSTGYRVVRHLYVEDGDLKAEDVTAKEITGFEREAGESVAALRPLVADGATKAKLADFARP